MPPQNQNNPNDQGRYDFFMNPSQPNKPRLIGTGSLKSRLILVIGGVILLIIIFSVISATLSGGPTATSLQTAVAEDQQEIARLTLSAAGNASNAVTKNFAITTNFTITSDQQQLVAYLAKNGHKLDAKHLGVKRSVLTDQNLASSLAAGVYDQAFSGVMNHSLTTYMTDLNLAYKKTTGVTGRKLLKNDYASAQVLLKQVKNLPSQ